MPIRFCRKCRTNHNQCRTCPVGTGNNVGNSPEVYEAWRQNARVDHERQVAPCDECGASTNKLVSGEHERFCSLYPELPDQPHDHPGLTGCTYDHDNPPEPGEETLALADALPGCGARTPAVVADTVTATLYVGLSHPDGNDWLWSLDDVAFLVAGEHEGFTMVKGLGSWRGNAERCAVVTVSDTKAAILATVAILNRELGQECIGVTYGAAMQFI